MIPFATQQQIWSSYSLSSLRTKGRWETPSGQLWGIVQAVEEFGIPEILFAASGESWDGGRRQSRQGWAGRAGQGG